MEIYVKNHVTMNLFFNLTPNPILSLGNNESSSLVVKSPLKVQRRDCGPSLEK